MTLSRKEPWAPRRRLDPAKVFEKLRRVSEHADATSGQTHVAFHNRANERANIPEVKLFFTGNEVRSFETTEGELTDEEQKALMTLVVGKPFGILIRTSGRVRFSDGSAFRMDPNQTHWDREKRCWMRGGKKC